MHSGLSKKENKLIIKRIVEHAKKELKALVEKERIEVEKQKRFKES